MKKSLLFGILGLGALVAAVLLAEKQRQPATATEPNPHAPATTDQTIQITASAERIWQVLSAVNQWPSWQPDIPAAHLNGPLQPGTSFDWKAGGLTIHSTLHTVESGRALGWSGSAWGAFAVHNWTLTPHEGYTEVHVAESMEGWLVSLLKPIFQPNLTSSITRWLAHLKQTAEKA